MALLIGAAIISVALFALGIGIFFWGVDLEHPESALVSGILLCCCPVLSPLAFMLVCFTRRWHRRVMWLMFGLSFVMTWFAILYRGSGGQFSTQDALSALRVTLQPLVMLPFLLAVLVEVAYQLKQDGIPVSE
jgi:hypothetical protein